MANTDRDIKEHLTQFQKFHSTFYSYLRSFLITGKFPEDFLESECPDCFPENLSQHLEQKTKKEIAKNRKPPSGEKLDERQTKYKLLLENTIKAFCIGPVAKLLADYHSLSMDFHKKEKGKRRAADEKAGIHKDKLDLPFRGIIFLHSREFGQGKKIAIPFGAWESDQETKVTNKVFNLRHSVNHILGEAMWRFFEPRDPKIPCIYFYSGGHSAFDNYENCFQCPLSDKIIESTEEFVKKLDVGKEKWYDDLYNKLNESKYWRENKTKEIIEDAKDTFEKWFPKNKQGKKELIFLIEGVRDYYKDNYIENNEDKNYDEVRRLLANPIRQAIISKAKNIFYIPDIHRSAITGGLVCELSLNKGVDKAEISSDELKDILRDLQWIFSNYVFAPISSCEMEFGSGIDFMYSAKFFEDKKTFDDFKYDLLDKVKNSEVENKFILQSTYEPLCYFFESVSGERGQYVRGFEAISKKAFIAICKLWNALKVFEIAGGELFGVADLEQVENIIERLGQADESAKKVFRGIIEKNPPLELLWDALDFEGALKNVPSYREHFIHSFHVLCLGLWIVSHKEFPYHQHLNDNFLKQWFLTALWHDVSYAIQELAHISNIFIKKLIKHGYKRKKKEPLLVPISPSWGHLLLAEDFYKLLLGDADFQDELNKALFLMNNDDIPDVMLEIMLNEARHEILSGLILYHQLHHTFIKNQSNDNKKEIREKLMPVIVAIMLHSCYDWKWKDEDVDTEKKATDLIRINIDKGTLAHLLMLCDSIVQAGREFSYVGEDSPDKEIKFAFPKNDENRIHINIKYEGFSDPIKHIKKKYFEPAQKVLTTQQELHSKVI